MRRLIFICLTWTLALLLFAVPSIEATDIRRRQDAPSSAANTATITSASGAGPTSNSAPAPTSTNVNSAAPTLGVSDTTSSSSVSSSEGSTQLSPSSNSTSTHHTTATSSSTLRPSATGARNSTSTAAPSNENVLPIQPRLTPAFGVGGVILLLTGTIYGLVGVKNQWVHTFLSTAYLTSLSIAVLIVYVMSPPISDAIQGAYFVGIFMTGLIFGAGALIFKEVTEGLGCLLGGFCLGMWFLTLKSGGLITNSAGKGIFLGVFCVVMWSLSFSHYTRAYGLIASTAFSGATVFVLGIDCFSRAGLKEFWVYIWGLNDNLFPLGTTTYPMTRGVRVEIIVIILATLVGVMSQIKLWKIVQAKQKKRDEAKQDEERRKDVVEHALGRHIERQNHKDRANWERQHGNRMSAKRSTVLWSEAHPDKSYTHISSQEMRKSSQASSSLESLEMSAVGAKRGLPYSSKNKRASTTVESIPEESEESQPQTRTSMERQKALSALQRQTSSDNVSVDVKPRTPVTGPEVVPLPFKIPASKNDSETDLTSNPHPNDSNLLQEPKRFSTRRSLQSLLSLSPRLSTVSVNESSEALVLPNSLHSRPSSMAATVDEENDHAPAHNQNRASTSEPATPKIIISPAGSFEDLTNYPLPNSKRLSDVPPSPPALSIAFDLEDPEELARPASAKPDLPRNANVLDKGTRASTLSNGTAKESSNEYDQSHISTGQTSAAEGLTKDALAHVPSQTSNVIMSYRTNEWAKHISKAEPPVFEEPAEIQEADPEPVTQLASMAPTSPTSPTASAKTLTASSKPPTPHVLADSQGKVIADVPPSDPSTSPAMPVEQFGATLAAFSPLPSPKIGSEIDSKPGGPIRTASTQSARPPMKGKQSSLNINMKQSLATTPIDENEAMVFKRNSVLGNRASMAKPNRVASTSSMAGFNIMNGRPQSTAVTPQSLSRSHSQTTLAEIQKMGRSTSAAGQYPNARPDSRFSIREEPQRSQSQLSNYAIRSDTRLDMYESRQPQRRDTAGQGDRRQNLLAEWRMSQQQGAVGNVVPRQQVDNRRAQMLLDKEHKRLMEDQQRAAQQQKQLAMDQVMRRPDMQDLHKEAMKRMQAKTKV